MGKIGRWIKGKKSILFVCVFTGALTVGMSLAWLADVEAVENKIKTGQVDIITEETLNGLEKTNISVTGRGSSPCYVRMMVLVPEFSEENFKGQPQVTFLNTNSEPQTVSGNEWNSFEDGKEILVGTVQDGRNSINQSVRWKKKEDGYWYLSVPLREDETAVLCEKVSYQQLEGENAELNLFDSVSKDQFNIVVYAEALQADNIDLGQHSGAEASYYAFNQLKEK